MWVLDLVMHLGMWQPVDHIKTVYCSVLNTSNSVKKQNTKKSTGAEIHLSEKIKLGLLLKNPLACQHANDAPGVSSRT